MSFEKSYFNYCSYSFYNIKHMEHVYNSCLNISDC